MLTLIRKARRRLLYNLLMSEGATAVTAALAAFILLLILGTQILNWYWALLIPAAAMVVAVYRIRKHLPALYASAQIVDRRMDLADSLSTAVFFQEEATARASAELRRLQLEQAERAAEGVDVRRAIPFALPRTAYAVAALILVAAGLFGLRYGLTRRLDLNQPIARILEQALGLDNRQVASAEQRKNFALGSSPEENSDGALEAQNPQDEPNQPGDSLDEATDSQDQASTGKTADKKSQNQDQQGDSQGGENQDGQAEADAPKDDKNSPSGQQGEKNGQNQQASNQNQSNSDSLLSKVREAMQNLLSSMKPQPSQSNSQQQQNQAQNGKQGKNQQSQGKQQGQKKGEKQETGQPGENQEGEPGDQSEQAENAPGQGTDPQATKQPGGGIGNRDGDKQAKEAAQLAAMGKITQIIGKRSATISGEATVEVQSTVQQLRTAYTDKNAQHASAGGEIGRDEIPVAFESYVERYFEQVRKQPAAKK